MIGDRKFKWAAHTAWGYPFNWQHNVIEHTFGYTHHMKAPANGTASAIHASITGSSAIQTVTTGITNPDVPRILAITIGGSGFSNDSITINGTNVEGKTIRDTFAYTGTGQVVGVNVFKSVTSIVLPSTLGSSATVTVDTTNKIGLNHRIPPNFGTIIALYDTQVVDVVVGQSPLTKPTADSAPTGSNVDNEFVEKNWVQTATAPNGSRSFYFYYWFHKVLVAPPKDSPEFYSTTTSTSTSSTSTSTSTSSTSSSTSSTSSSTSSTSTSFSSTSTSTTTLPV